MYVIVPLRYVFWSSSRYFTLEKHFNRTIGIFLVGQSLSLWVFFASLFLFICEYDLGRKTDFIDCLIRDFSLHLLSESFFLVCFVSVFFPLPKLGRLLNRYEILFQYLVLTFKSY